MGDNFGIQLAKVITSGFSILSNNIGSTPEKKTVTATKTVTNTTSDSSRSRAESESESTTTPAPDYQKLINDYINKIGWSKEMTPEQHKEHAVNLMNLRFATTTETSGGKRKKPKTEKLKRKRIRVKKDVDAI